MPPMKEVVRSSSEVAGLPLGDRAAAWLNGEAM